MTVRTSAVVLLVQAERDDREIYSEFLRFHGFEPIAVASAADAWSLAPCADVVVTGILLPGDADGIEFIVHLKHDERTARIPIIVLSTCAWTTERERAAQAGCAVFLAKPCLPNVLVNEIRRLLAVQQVPKPQPATALSPTPRVRRTS